MNLVGIARDLRSRVERLRFGEPVTHVYNPLRYAWRPHKEYLERYGTDRRRVLLVGMNPGPWGMAQTGVPFGDVVLVRDWLKVRAPVGRPADEHPKRKIEGFACSRREVSGQRLWGWARDRFRTPSRFFQRLFVLNYCPLCFLEESGRNRTPDRLSPGELEPLLEVCDAALQHVIDTLQPRYVLGVGRFAERRARRVLCDSEVQVGFLSHPSPANPSANRNWAEIADRSLAAAGISLRRR
jgi:single-strand selective monofunctional uracil DNA glycosylase